ncbi:hypothetical protein KAW08_00390 [bacterium]|nr:hypothetical protein [bacterium]
MKVSKFRKNNIGDNRMIIKRIITLVSIALLFFCAAAFNLSAEVVQTDTSINSFNPPPKSTLNVTSEGSISTMQADSSGRVAHWKFDEGSGTVAYDSVGTNHGAIQGATWVSGVIGGALSFDGIDDYVNCGSDSSLDFGDGTDDFPFSFAAWLKRDSNTVILSKYDTSNYPGPLSQQYSLSARLNKFTVSIFDTSGDYRKGIITTNTFDLNWHHLVATYDGSSTVAGLNLYVDGIKQAVDVIYDDPRYVAMEVTSVSFKIGSSIDSVGTHHFFDGIMDEVAIYNRALAPSEIRQLYMKDEKGVPQNWSLSPDDPAHPCNNSSDPVNITNGALTKVERDIYIPARGIPTYIERAYNSRNTYDGPFGYGWTFNYNTSLTENAGLDVTWTDEDGSLLFFDEDNGSYASPSGCYATLTKTDNIFTLTQKHGIKYIFENQDTDASTYELSRIEDPNGNAITLTYSGGLLTKLTDPSNRDLIFTYSGNRIASIADADNRTVFYTYDVEGDLVKAIDADGKETTYIYTGHNITTVTDPEGHQWHWAYDENDRCIKQTDDLGREMIFDYDFISRTTTLTNEKGNETIYVFNPNGFIDQITDAYGDSTIYTWGEDINRSGIIDNNGNQTKFTYDENGNLIQTEDALGNITTYTYEPVYNLVASVTDAKDNTTTYDYDTKSNLTKITDALGNETAFTYDTYGQMKTMTDANNHITSFVYDTYGNLTNTTDAQGNPTAFTYDILGNNTSITNANNHTTSFTYDQLSRLTQITYPDNTKAAYTYDANDNLITFTDPNDNTTTNTYNEFNQLSAVTDALGQTTSSTYDEVGNRITVADAKDNITSYVYDKVNRLIKTTTALGKESSFTYDPVGNQLAVTDAKDNTTSYTYDLLNQLTQIKYADNSTVDYTYDELGRRTSMADSTGTTTYEYDNLNRVVSVGTGLAPVRYDYDKVGNRISMTDQNEGVTGYQYDELNRLVSLTAPNGKMTNYSYDSVSNLTNMNLPNNTQVNYQFDNLNRLLNLTNKKNSGDNISSFNYEYNLAGMRNKVMLADGSYIEYEYDDLNRLTKEAKYDPQRNVLYSNTYEFDSAGNRLKLTKLVHGTLEEKSFEDDFNRRKLGDNWQVVDGRWRIIGRRWLFGWARNKGEVIYNSEDSIGNFEAEVDLSRIYLRYKRAQLAGISYQGAEGRRVAGVKGELKKYLEKKKVKRTIIIWKWKKVKIWRWYRWVRYPVKKTYWRWKYHWRIKRQVSYVLGHYEESTLVEDAVFTEKTKRPVFSKRIKVKVEDEKAELFAKENGDWVKKIEFVYPSTEDGKVGLFVHGKRVAYARFDNFKLTYQVGTLPQEEIINYAYNEENQLLTVDNGQGQALSLQYDDNGNLVKKDDSQGAIDYSWDYENRLVGIDYLDGSSDSYTYDGVGKRIQTSEDGIVTNYLYDGLNCIIEQDNTGLTTASYVRGLGYSGGIGSIVSKQTPVNGKQYYYYDGIGNVVNLADNCGLTTDNFAYDAYGNILNSAIPNPHGFSTKEYSRRSGLSYFGARYYDSRIGRWTQPDPLGMVNGPNLYLYVNNNPINNIDPHGLMLRRLKNLWDISGFGRARKSSFRIRTTVVTKTNATGGKASQKTKGCSTKSTSSSKAYWKGFGGSLKDQAWSMTHPFASGAYKKSALGQSAGAGRFTKYGTRVAMGTAGVATAGYFAAPYIIKKIAPLLIVGAMELATGTMPPVVYTISNQVRTVIQMVIK